jgi:hypothetical protein
LFKKIKIPYSIYNRGLYAELDAKGELDQIGEIFNPLPIVEEPTIESVIEPIEIQKKLLKLI